jgi:hypothetical protein
MFSLDICLVYRYLYLLEGPFAPYPATIAFLPLSRYSLSIAILLCNHIVGL